MEEILNILDKEKGNVSRAKIAQMLGMEEKEVADKIEKMEKENVIVGYKTIVNWDKTDKDVVVALIELRITPQRGEGFDKVAERIYKYPQVKSLYLMSGAYDLAVTIEGKSMKEVALFVAQKLAPMDSIISTALFAAVLLHEQDFVQNLACGQTARASVESRRAELAAHSAADLRRNADGHAMLIVHQYGLHAVAVPQTP